MVVEERADWTFAVRLARDTLPALVTRPLQWGTRSWAAFVVFVLAATLMFLEKRSIQAVIAVHAHHNGWDVAAASANTLGSGWTMLAVGAGGIVIGRASSQRLLRAAIVFAVAGLWGWSLLILGQLVLAEARPFEGGAMRFFALHGHGVSGHACAAALLFAPVCEGLRGIGRVPRSLVTAALFVWVVFIAWSRVRLNMHYAWNVLVGAAIGAYVSRVTVDCARGTRYARCDSNTRHSASKADALSS